MTIDIQLDEKKPAKIVTPELITKSEKPIKIESPRKKKKWSIFVLVGIVLLY